MAEHKEYKVHEKYRKIVFINGKEMFLKNIVSVDNSGTYLRLTTDTQYLLINPAHVLYHELPAEDKVF